MPVGVWLSKGDDNVFTQIGLIVLVGLSAKNAILIVEFARELEFVRRSLADPCRDRGEPAAADPDDVDGVHHGRAAAGLSTGAGSEMQRVMGIAVFSGMIGVTVFGLLLTPVFYVLLRSLTGMKPLTQHGEATIPGKADAA